MESQLPSKKTKIVCTIGPASQSTEVLEQLIVEGMNIARLNFAHGSPESHAQIIANIRQASANTGLRVAILGDLPGPKIRIGRLSPDPLQLVQGRPFILEIGDRVGDEGRASTTFERLPDVVSPGDNIFLSDGFIMLAVQQVTGREVRCLVKVGGELRSHKGINLPGIDLGISAFTDLDRAFLSFACRMGLDAISQSFVERPADIHAVRQAAADCGSSPIIIAKIERARAVQNLDEILDCADGIMVARGDLGVEIPIEEMALVQRDIIRRANLQAKPVITATQMLESMVSHNRPTRAEATDVANAILNGTDCVMLSEETATGQFPVEAVNVMSRIAKVTEPSERSTYVADLLNGQKTSGAISKEDLISLSIFRAVESICAVAVVTPTLTGATPRRVTRFRLPVWVIAVTPEDKICGQLQFSYGVYPVRETNRPAAWESYTREWLAGHGITEKLVLLTKGSGTGVSGGTDQIEIIDLDAPLSEHIVW